MATGKRKRVGIYARVSTTEQTAENQLIPLQEFAAQRGWEVRGEFIDEGISGAQESRPQLDRLMDAARKREVDLVLCWKLDRMARSVRHLVLMLDEFRALGVEFTSFTENLDFSSAMGRAMFAIIAAMAELERGLVIERVHAGLRRARAQGKRIGRPPAALDTRQLAALKGLGLGVREIARRMGASRSTVGAVLKTMALAEPSEKPEAPPADQIAVTP